MKKARTTREEKKERAVEIMKQLDIYGPYIKGFKEKDCVCFFENFGGFYAYQEPELQNKLEEIEKEFNCVVYGITHEYTEFGECYSFLLVTDYKSEWKRLVETEDGRHYAFSYVWNKDDDFCSEFGTVALRSFGGGITRIG